MTEYAEACRKEIETAGTSSPRTSFAGTSSPGGKTSLSPGPAFAGARCGEDGIGAFSHHPATSVFFGGGTPSLLPVDLLSRILRTIETRQEAEVTVECNPETVDRELLEAYRAAGVTRLSFGVQSMVPKVLASLGRRHDPETVTAAVRAAGEAGFADNYSVDLIYGAAGESLRDWLSTLETVLDLDPPPRHVSAYALTVEAGTPLAKQPARHPDPDDQADKYLITEEVLRDAGLSWYEVSNWSMPGAECRHNQLYWSQGEYAGIGCSAHSHRVQAVGSASRATRWWNVRTPERYIRLVQAGRSPVAAGELLDHDQRRSERVALRLRTRAGLALAELPESKALRAELDALGESGLLVEEGGSLTLTLKGRLLANEAIIRLSNCLPAAA